VVGAEARARAQERGIVRDCAAPGLSAFGLLREKSTGKGEFRKAGAINPCSANGRFRRLGQTNEVNGGALSGFYRSVTGHARAGKGDYGHDQSVAMQENYATERPVLCAHEPLANSGLVAQLGHSGQ